MPLRLLDIAEYLGARVEGDPAAEISGVGPLDEAKPGDLAFLANPRYASKVPASHASALVLAPKDLRLRGEKHAVVSDNPYRDFARVVAKWFASMALPQEGIHPTAVVASSARIGRGCRIGALAVIEDGVEIGDQTTVFALAYLGREVKIGSGCLIYPSVTILERCRVGDRVILHSGVVLGSDGFGFAADPPHGWVKVPQTGTVVVEDDVEIQANSCVDRGALGPTRIGQGSKLDNLVQVAHNVVIGRNSVLAAQSGVSGSTKVGNWVTFAGQSGAAGHLEIGDQAIITGQAGAGKDVPAGAIVSGSPAQPAMEYRRGLAEVGKLPELKARVKQLEKRLEALEKKYS